MRLRWDFLGVFLVLDSIFPQYEKETPANGAKKEDGDPDREHEDVVLILGHDALGVQSRLLVVYTGATT